mmetsp:Transcript_4843/g.11674  ORF Transcript_4843/g.11674 Transcript_4843/m.11674 type:complete len:315 (+) Transcript_4843:161-1105(+)
MTAREQSLNAESEEDTNDRVCVYPRRKAGEEKMGSDRPPVIVTREVLQQNFQLPLTAVAKKLNLSTTVIKQICRRLKIDKWPYKRHKSSIENASKDGEDKEEDVPSAGSTPQSFSSPRGQDVVSWPRQEEPHSSVNPQSPTWFDLGQASYHPASVPAHPSAAHTESPNALSHSFMSSHPLPLHAHPMSHPSGSHPHPFPPAPQPLHSDPNSAPYPLHADPYHAPPPSQHPPPQPLLAPPSSFRIPASSPWPSSSSSSSAGATNAPTPSMPLHFPGMPQPHSPQQDEEMIATDAIRLAVCVGANRRYIMDEEQLT